MDPVWYIGPPGDLRAIVCPERDIVMSPIRYGGIHQSLSGNRTMDVTGVRTQFEFTFRFLDDDELDWINALYYRLVPGPHRMINPLSKNRLTVESAGVKVGVGSARGALLTGGIGSRVRDVPVDPLLGSKLTLSTKWTNRTGTNVIRFDEQRKTLMVPGETVTGSVWLKSSVALAGSIVFDWWQDYASKGNSGAQSVNLTTSWQRFTITKTVPSDVNLGQLAFYTGTTAPDIYIAGAQVEAGSSATSWAMGGGAPTVVIDQLETTSPRFPYRDIKATILEA